MILFEIDPSEEKWSKGFEYHYKYWFTKLSQEYNKIAEGLGGLKAYREMKGLHEDISNRQEIYKGQLDNFGRQIRSIITPKPNFDKGSKLEKLYEEIEFAASKTFNSRYISDFEIGLKGYSNLEETIESYIELTGQENGSGVIAHFKIYYPMRVRAGRFFYQLMTLDTITERSIINDYPSFINPNDIGRTPLETFIAKMKARPGTSTNEKYIQDVYSIIARIERNKNEERYRNLFNENGKLVISQVVDFALDDDDFYDKWSDENEDGYSKRWHKKKFKEINEALLKN